MTDENPQADQPEEIDAPIPTGDEPGSEEGDPRDSDQIEPA